MKRIYFDSEFMEDGKTIEPLSLGFVDDEDELYVVITDVDHADANEWVKENVIPHLYLSDDDAGDATILLCSRDEAAKAIGLWVGEGPVEFWADYGAYDWVLLCQLYGTMLDWPSTWPMYVHDIQQLADAVLPNDLRKSLPEADDEGTPHNALADARLTRTRWRYLQ